MSSARTVLVVGFMVLLAVVLEAIPWVLAGLALAWAMGWWTP